MSNNFTIYRSSAGSGKTHTLVKEYIKLAISGSDYAKRFSKILAITFTNKAAGEMKERVIKNLYTLKLDSTHKEFSQNYLNEIAEFCQLNHAEVQKRASVVFANILHNYHLLKITTIDKFTVSLVYSFARDLQIDADHEIVTDVTEVIDAGIQILLDQSGKDKELTEMFVDFLGFEMDEGNKFNAKKELRKFCSKVMNEKGFEALELSSQHSEKEFIDACKKAAQKVKEMDEYVKKIITSIFELLNQNEIREEDFWYKGLGNYSWLENVYKKGIFNVDLTGRVLFFIDDELKRWQAKINLEKQTTVKRIEPQIVEGFRLLVEFKKTELKNYIVHSTVRNNAFSMAIFKRLHAAITEYKTANSIILLSEFTQLVSDVVANEPAPFIFERLGERVKNIFVDEFQDTSTLQFSNLIPLIENSLSTNEFTMLVGDAKQSIYRWRNGNVEQFIELSNLPESTLKNHPYRQKVFKDQFKERLLPTNYRSLKNIVEFNNQFFAQLVRHPNFESPILTSAYKDLFQESIQEKQGGYIEFELSFKQKANNKKHDDENDNFDTETEEEINARIEFTYNSIQKSIQNGYNYGDIAILVRKHTEGETIFSGLRKKNIPVISNQALSLSVSLEIGAIISLFKCLQPNHNSTSYKYFMLNYAKYLESFEKFESEIAQISNSTNLTTVLQLFNVEINKHTFISLNLFEQLHYIASSLGMPQDNAFLNAFFELVFSFFKKNGSNSLLFIDWWEQKSESFKVQTNQNSNSVKIITVHKSKGLQYPVVILPYTNIDVRKSDEYFWLKNVPGYAIKPLPVNYSKILADTEWNIQYETEKNKSAFDVINVLYVAFTRAEEQIFCYVELTETNYQTNPISVALTEMGWLFPSTIFTKGNLVMRKNENEKVIPIKTGIPVKNETNFSSWFTKLRVSAFMTSEKHQKNELRRKGIILHFIASRIANQSEINYQIQKNKILGLINDIEAIELNSDFQAFYSSKIYLDLLINCSAQLNEIEITDGNGNVNRPDRVFVYPGNNTIVIDLKTGEKDEEHAEQVKQYIKLLSNAGYDSSYGWLYYFKTQEWIKV